MILRGSLVLLVSLSPLAAQQSVVVPTGFGYATKPGNNGIRAGLSRDSYSRHMQVTHMNRMGVQLAPLQQVEFRRWARTGDFPALVVQFTMLVGHGPLAPGKMSTTWGNNVTGTLTTVFSGQFNLPATTGSTDLHPWSVTVKFTRPFIFNSQLGHFVCDWECTAPANSASWYRDARYIVDTQTTPSYVSELGAGCPGSNHQFPTIAVSQPTAAIPGTGMQVDLTKADASVQVALSILGLQYAFPFPIDLSGAGANGCWLYTDLMLMAPFTVSNGTGSLTWPLPNIASIGGGIVITQAFLFDAKANALGLAATNALMVTLGNLPVGAGNWATDTIYTTVQNAATGTKVTLDYGVIMRITY